MVFLGIYKTKGGGGLLCNLKGPRNTANVVGCGRVSLLCIMFCLWEVPSVFHFFVFLFLFFFPFSYFLSPLGEGSHQAQQLLTHEVITHRSDRGSSMICSKVGAHILPLSLSSSDCVRSRILSRSSFSVDTCSGRSSRRARAVSLACSLPAPYFRMHRSCSILCNTYFAFRASGFL